MNTIVNDFKYWSLFYEDEGYNIKVIELWVDKLLAGPF